MFEPVTSPTAYAHSKRSFPEILIRLQNTRTGHSEELKSYRARITAPPNATPEAERQEFGLLHHKLWCSCGGGYTTREKPGVEQMGVLHHRIRFHF